MRAERPIRRFGHIIHKVDAIGRYTAGLDCELFFADEKTRDAALHCPLRIGEAARKLGKTAGEHAPDLPRRNIRDIGNRLRHDYDALGREQVWAIISEELTPPPAACEKAIVFLGTDKGSWQG